MSGSDGAPRDAEEEAAVLVEGTQPGAGAPAVRPSFDALVQSIVPAPKVVRLRGGARCAIILRPAEVRPGSVARIYDTITQLSAEIFGEGSEYFWRREHASGLFFTRRRFYLLGDSTGELIGWTSYSKVEMAGRSCLFYDWAAVVPGAQRAGLISRIYARANLDEFLRHPLRTTYAVGVSRNPSVYVQYRRAMGEANVFPRLDGRLPEVPRAIAESCASWMAEWNERLGRDLSIELDAETLVLRGDAVEFSSPGADIRASGDPEVDEFFRRHLTWADSFVVLTRIGPPFYASYMMRRLGRTLSGARRRNPRTSIVGRRSR